MHIRFSVLMILVACGPSSGPGADGGQELPADSGVTIDGGGGAPNDAGTLATDGGSPGVDAGPEQVDDAGASSDGGPPVVDSGTPAADSGSPATDAGGTVVDAGQSAPLDASVPAETRMVVQGETSEHGIFDFAPERDDGGIVWLSYSWVTDSLLTNKKAISTHLARSSDNGATYTEQRVVNANEYLPLSQVPGSPVDAGVWVHETSRLRQDPYAPANERWVLVWHRYLSLPLPVPDAEQRRFEHGWIGLRTAPAPDDTWSAERKLITAVAYDTNDDVFIGPPEVKLTDLSSSLANCLVVTEPALLIRQDDWVLALQCEGSSTSRILMLRKDRNSGAWSYLGSVLPDSVASAEGYDGYAAPELVQVGSTTYLLVTPQVAGAYKGCRAYEVTSLTPPMVGATPVLTWGLGSSTSNFAGACAYIDGLATGVLESEHFLTSPNFRVFATHRALP